MNSKCEIWICLLFCYTGFSIEGPSQARIECDDKGDGSCDVRYWPTEPGDYAVHVICDDEDIKDSPFIAHILPAANDIFPEKVIPTHWIMQYARWPVLFIFKTKCIKI